MKDAFENSFKQSLDNFELPYDSSAWDAMRSRLDAGAAGTDAFEQQMKESLNANDYPYNATAWSALENRLDSGKKGGSKFWYIAAGIVLIAAISTYALYPSEKESTTAQENTTGTW